MVYGKRPTCWRNLENNYVYMSSLSKKFLRWRKLTVIYLISSSSRLESAIPLDKEIYLTIVGHSLQRIISISVETGSKGWQMHLPGSNVTASSCRIEAIVVQLNRN